MLGAVIHPQLFSLKYISSTSLGSFPVWNAQPQTKVGKGWLPSNGLPLAVCGLDLVGHSHQPMQLPNWLCGGQYLTQTQQHPSADWPEGGWTKKQWLCHSSAYFSATSLRLSPSVSCTSQASSPPLAKVSEPVHRLLK